MDMDLVPASHRAAVRNNGGGYYNHTMFWEIMSHKGKKKSDAFHDLLETSFGSVKDFKAQFAAAAASRFGSGWAWLVLTEE